MPYTLLELSSRSYGRMAAGRAFAFARDCATREAVRVQTLERMGAICMVTIDGTTRESRRRNRALSAWGMALALCSACGSHDDSPNPAPSAGTSGSGASGMGGRNAGKAGASGAAGAAGTKAGGAGSPSPTVICGGKECAPPPAGLSALAGSLPIQGVPIPIACCVDDMCGTAPSAMGSCEPRALADARCPEIDPGALLMQFSGGAIAGCCTAGNACGVDGALFGRGCIENGEAAIELGMIPFLGSTITVPPARSCDPELSADGGV
jgi:hypothetical protein